MSGHVDVVLIRVDLAADAYGNHPRHRHPALDLKYIEAGIVERTGAVVRSFDAWQDGAATTLLADALACRPRVAVIKAASWCLDEALVVAKALRRAGAVTLAVGQQVAHAARVEVPGWDEAIDIPVPGDPEAIVPELVAELLAGGDPGVVGRSTRALFVARSGYEIEAPDRLPAISFSSAELRAFPFPFPLRRSVGDAWAYLLTSWGCPRACRHCSVVVRKSSGVGLRKRTPAAVADEVERRLDSGAAAIAFEDDSLFVDPRFFHALCDEFARRGLRFPWLANARPDELDAARVAAAKDCGALLLKVGVDCGSYRLIERIGKARSGSEWNVAVRESFVRLHAAGIGSIALFMVGLPDETVAEVEMSIRLARAIEPDYVQVQIYSPYPDVPLWDELPAELRAAKPLYHYRSPLVSASRMSVQEVVAAQRRFYREFYFRPGFVARHLVRNWRGYLQARAWTRSAGALAYLSGGARR